jgi:hypothetical protein
MIKEELAVNNIISFEQEDYIVKGIREDKVFLQSIKLDSGLETAKVSEIEGKEINGSFLINNQFIKTDDKFFKNFYGHYILYNIKEHSISIDCLSISPKRIILPNIKYIHELQNIFTILKIDFKLEL